MASKEDTQQVTRKQIVRLASAIPADNMEFIAEGYMDIDDVTIKNIRGDANNSVAFNRDIIRHWLYKNPDNQVENLSKLLHEAALDCGYVDPIKMREILGVTSQKVTKTTKHLSGNLTERQIFRLNKTIMPNEMAVIAETYMGIDDVTIRNMKVENDKDAFQRKILEYWIDKNREDQIQRLASLLYKASEEHGHVNLQQVLPILEVSERVAHLGSLPEVTKEEFLTLAEELRPWTQRAMKIEVAPWIRDYVVDMQELYCELLLEKLTYMPSGKNTNKVDNYLYLFDQDTKVPNKILAKANPGMGKTTLVKKIAWDWAKGKFTKVSIVLFLMLKSVHPEDSLEDVLLEQMPELVGLGITKDKLESFIECFGKQCLLICDGLDENALGTNKDVLKVLKHKKYPYCNVFITSRPHSTRAIESHFDTIVNVEGFTRSEAKRFALCVVPDEVKVEQILDFNPAGGRQDVALHKCPILLSFICILVREYALDLSDNTMPTGEIYTRMIQCLYKKFTIRRNIKYDEMEFTKVVGLVGKLAWETLLSDDPLFEERELRER